MIGADGRVIGTIETDGVFGQVGFAGFIGWSLVLGPGTGPVALLTNSSSEWCTVRTGARLSSRPPHPPRSFLSAGPAQMVHVTYVETVAVLIRLGVGGLRHRRAGPRHRLAGSYRSGWRCGSGHCARVGGPRTIHPSLAES
jgi:hypothetical protein